MENKFESETGSLNSETLETSETPETTKSLEPEPAGAYQTEAGAKEMPAKKIAETVAEIKNTPEVLEKEYAEIKTMADFIEYLKAGLLAAKDEQEKKALAISLLRLKSAFTGLRKKPDQYKIGVTAKGEWSVYKKNAREFRVSPEILSAVQDCRISAKEMNIAFREAELEEKGVADTGFQQLLIENKFQGNTGEYHKKEKWSAKRIFGKSEDTLDRVMDAKALADYFLEKEVQKRLDQGRDIKARELAADLSPRFKKGAPEAFKKLMRQNYSFREQIQNILDKSGKSA